MRPSPARSIAGAASEHARAGTPGVLRMGASADASCEAQAGQRSMSHSTSVQVQQSSAAALDVRLVDAREEQRQAERLSLMHGGAVLYKYQRGEGGLSARLFAPRQEKRREERLLKLSEDSRELRWAKPSSGGAPSRLKLSEVLSLVHGHNTELFRQMLIVPDAAELCFSLITAKRTYSFAARTSSQAETWIVGLSVLCQLPMRRRGAFLWNELRLRTRAEAEGNGLAALLPRIARELDESRQSRAGGTESRTSSRALSLSSAAVGGGEEEQ